jgi:hypothetical protein
MVCIQKVVILIGAVRSKAMECLVCGKLQLRILNSRIV